MIDEDKRAEHLLAAQASAARLFQAVEDRGLVAPGAGEREVSDRIRDLANEMFGPTRHWHKRIGITGQQLYDAVTRRAAQAGWTPGGWHAGHLVGEVREPIAGALSWSLSRCCNPGRQACWIA